MNDCVALLFVFLGLFSNLQSAQINGTMTSLLFGPKAKLEIDPPFMPGIGSKLIIKKTNESLNLTCSVVNQNGTRNDSLFDYDVDWKISTIFNYTSNINRGNVKNMAWLWFDRLSERDAGNYTCKAITSEPFPIISLTIYLSVKTVKTKPSFCGAQWFRCRSTNCIMERYVCDGKKDCEEGEDEGPTAGCGSDPCYGKIFCGERCIPSEWCCDYRNCSTTFGLRPWPPETHEISYVQTAFYTVIGCAMAFMFIVTILVIAICRVQIKRAMNTRWNQRNRDICRRAPRSVSFNMPIYDVDLYLNRAADNYPGVNIMYNINSGVQFVGQPIEPPPYSEVIATPPREGPPPPYVSCENLAVRSSIPRVLNNSTVCEVPAIQNESYNTDVPYNYHPVRGIRDSESQVPSASSASPRIESDVSLRPPIQALDVEYVETDALLSENPQNCIIQTCKNLSKVNNRIEIQNKWLAQEYSDKINDKIRFNRQISDDTSNPPSVRARKSSTDIENEGIFLETDPQESNSSSPIFSSQTEPCSSLTRGLSSSEAGPSFAGIGSNESKEINNNNKKLIKANDDKLGDNTYLEVGNVRHCKKVSLHPSQVHNREIIKREDLICENELSKNESSNMSTSVSSNVRDIDDGTAQASESLILPLRESFIGVQKGN